MISSTISTVLAGTVLPDFGFVSMYQHGRSGLNLTLFRQYDPQIGRWLSRDPLGEAGGLNLYGYARNNPISRTDRLGLWDDAEFWRRVNAYRDAYTAAGMLIGFWGGGTGGALTTAGTMSIPGAAAGTLAGGAIGGLAGIAVGATSYGAEEAGKGIYAMSGSGYGTGWGSSCSGLKQSYESETLFDEAKAGKFDDIIAGPGDRRNRQITDLPRLLATYGGEAADWAKYSTRSMLSPDGSYRYAVHWYENVKTGLRVEFKTKIDVIHHP